jgi:hypothetical protein
VETMFESSLHIAVRFPVTAFSPVSRASSLVEAAES